MGVWRGVSKGRPCAICASKSGLRCSYTDDGAVWCMYTDGAEVAGWRKLVGGTRPENGVDEHGGTVYRPADEAHGPGSAFGAAAIEAQRQKREAHEAKETARAIERARVHWRTCGGAVDHPAMRMYFQARGVPLNRLEGGKLPPALRYVPRAEYWFERGRNDVVQLAPGPAVYCGAVDKGGTLTGIQRIYLDVHGAPAKRAIADLAPPGSEAGKESAKKAAGKIAEVGAAVRLGRSTFPGGVLCLTEGVETGLAVQACGLAAWACVSTSGLLNVEIPEDLVAPRGPVTRIVFMADHDKIDARRGFRPGHQKATIAANRLAARFPACRVVVREPRAAEAPGLIGAAPGSEDAFGDILTGKKSVDWLDVVARGDEGVNAVIAAVAESAGEAPPHAPAEPAAERAEDAEENAAGGEGGNGDGAGAGDGGAGDEPVKLLPAGALSRARLALRELWTPDRRVGQRWTLAYLAGQDQFVSYDGRRYRTVRDVAVQSVILQLFEGYRVLTAEGIQRLGHVDPDAPETCRGVERDDTKRAALSASQVREVMDALKSEVAVHEDALPVWSAATFDEKGRSVYGVGAWPDFSESAPVRMPVAYRNGLLDMDRFIRGSVVMLPHTPRFVSTACIPYELPVEEIRRELARDPDGVDDGGDILARLAPRTAAALGEVCDGDTVKLRALQQCCGLVQTFDVSFEVAFLLVGPPASFKGTWCELLTAVVGMDNTAYTSLVEVTERFETANLVGKPLAIIDEAHVGHRTDAVEAVRRLKTMISAMPVSADVKFGEKRSFVRPQCRFVITANELPKLPDASAAMVRRLVVIPFTRSFAAKMDRTLKRDVIAEAAGVAAWGLFGYRSLLRTGSFVLPQDGADMLEDFRRLSSQVFAFLSDCCVVEPLEGGVGDVRCKALYALYRAWAEAGGLSVLSEERFGSQLKAAVPGLRRITRKVAHMGRWMAYEGVRPRLAGEPAGEKGYRRVEHIYDLGGIADDFGFEVERATVGGGGGGDAWWNRDGGVPT